MMDKEEIKATPKAAKRKVSDKKRRRKHWYGPHQKHQKESQSKEALIPHQKHQKEPQSKEPLIILPNSERRDKFEMETLNETSYCLKDGLRFVFPYPYEHKKIVRKAWVDMTILNVLCNEIGKETKEHYEEALEKGMIKVSGNLVSWDRVLKTGDTIHEFIHRHELPVVHQAIEFIQNDDDMVVINKPSSIPVQPCGKYRHNSVLLILAKEYNLTGLRVLNQIDRLASGIVMFAKTQAKKRQVLRQKKQITERKYFARVVGKFPSGEIVVNEPVLLATSHAHFGLGHVHPDGTPSSTKFKLIKYNGKSSLVSCELGTKWEYQIRIHLHHLGHPIINDPIYNNPALWVKHNGSYNIDDVLRKLLMTMEVKLYYSLRTDDSNLNGVQVNSDSLSEENDVCHKKRKLEEGVDSGCCKEADENEKERSYYTSSYFGEMYTHENCAECKRKWKLPWASDLVMYLHSFHHKQYGLEYKTSIPCWAGEDWYFC